jgi:riboflavin-specific deaminase-like protein
VHRLRSRHDGILVGIGTVLSDNPRLTTRLAEGTSPRPVILDSTLHTPPGAAIFQHPLPPLIACSDQADPTSVELLRAAGAQIVHLPTGEDGRLSLPALLETLRERGITSLMVEGGASVLTSFLAEGLADALVVTIAPCLMGGQQAILARPAHQLAQPHLTQVGKDFVIWGALG